MPQTAQRPRPEPMPKRRERRISRFTWVPPRSADASLWCHQASERMTKTRCPCWSHPALCTMPSSWKNLFSRRKCRRPQRADDASQFEHNGLLNRFLNVPEYKTAGPWFPYRAWHLSSSSPNAESRLSRVFSSSNFKWVPQSTVDSRRVHGSSHHRPMLPPPPRREDGVGGGFQGVVAEVRRPWPPQPRR